MISKPRLNEYFGKGKLQELIDKVRSMPQLTAVFIAVDRLTGLQYSQLTKIFGCRVYDRYTVVLHIFRNHARTGESKLQIALAEIPYIRARLRDALDSNPAGHQRCNYQRAGRSFLQIKQDQMKKNKLTFKEIETVAKTKINKNWRIPPKHSWYIFGAVATQTLRSINRHAKAYPLLTSSTRPSPGAIGWYSGVNPGGALNIRNRQHQTTLTRFRTGHLKPLKIENNNKIYPTCPKCSLAPAAPEHILA
ncbi:GTPBP6 [Cordylochernes scorpioides]|uniref:GTPBP6 n=1 Tax=Cordylochernes scorpioides TaxID=51811 RepID=A0ABY6LER8_9ARAC|nr:GTPBP6 [Cordylochernes scorpioides]